MCGGVTISETFACLGVALCMAFSLHMEVWFCLCGGVHGHCT